MQAAIAVTTLLISTCVSATQGLSLIGSPSTSPSPADSAPISFTGAPAPFRFLHGPTASPTPAAAASTGKIYKQVRLTSLDLKTQIVPKAFQAIKTISAHV
ncbi:unnamed protein product [Sphagnum balticum]